MEATSAGMAALQPKNVLEDWSIYDTVQIRKNVKDREGYNSYSALAQVDEIPFMDIRKADIGLAYTNRDSNEGAEFAFRVKQLGVQFIAPPLKTEDPVEGTPDTGPDNPCINALFSFLLNHCGLILKIREDDKLRHTVALAPGGGGMYGLYTSTVSPIPPVNTLTNGEPYLNNQWVFSGDGIAIPRGATFSVRLRFSAYARQMMLSWPGPGDYTFDSGDGDVKIPSCALIRVALTGWREVQQRGELHY